MITLNIYLRVHGKSIESGVIYVSFYVNREKINFSTHVRCNVQDWDENKRCVKKSDAKHEDKNLVLSNIAARINNVFVKYRLKDKKLTRSAFLRAYNRPDDYDTFHLFTADIKKIVNRGNELSTLQNHTKILNKVKKYDPRLHFDDITPEWLANYFRYLTTTLKNNENTAYKNMSIIGTYVKEAVKQGYMDEDPYEEFTIKRVQGSFTYLNENELHTFVNAYTEGYFDSKYHKTLEFYLFLCFSSLHIGDASGLKLEQFTEDSFVYVRKKTGKKKPVQVIVPVSDTLRKLVKNIVGTRKKGLIFEKLPAEQTINKRLKEIAVELGVDKKLSTKSGRHTFATIYLANTKDLTALKEILGHSDLRETLIYAHVLDQSKQEGILCFNKFSSDAS
jgi:integrase